MSHQHEAGLGKQPGKFVIISCVLLPLGLVLLATLGFDIPPRQILGDPSTFTEQPSYLGLFSDLGFLGWWTATIACFLALGLAREPRHKGALMLGGALSAVLCLDDLMLLHEAFGAKLFFAFYMAGSALYVFRYRSLHREVGVALLFTALFFLAASVGIDLVRDLYHRWPGLVDRASSDWLGLDVASWNAGRALPVDSYRSPGGANPGPMAIDDIRRLAEDGCKFVGIVAWAAYHLYLARYCILPRVDSQPRI